MSTTRHLLNRQRRVAAQQSAGAEAPAADKAATDKAATATGKGTATGNGTPGARTATAVRERAWSAPRTATKSRPAEGAPSPAGDDTKRTGPRVVSRRLLGVCAVVTVAFGAFAAWGASEAGALRDGAAARNTALADAGRTSEVKGEVTSAVNALFSYDYARPTKNTRAAKRLLTGRAVKQHRALLAQVRAQGGTQRLVLTTTVTDSAVAALEGDRARVLLFADQHSARTGESAQKKGKSKKDAKKDANKDANKDDATYAGAMLSVDAVRTAGTWKIANIDTLN